MPIAPIAAALLAVVLGASPALTSGVDPAGGSPRPAPAPHRVAALKITVLSTMLADRGIGEWGYAALVEADGRRILFDTGARPETVLANARELGIDLSSVTDVVLSHNHGDHTGGLLALRRALAPRNPAALSRVHVARGIFWPRPGGGGAAGERNPMVALRAEFEATGGAFVEHDGPAELLPGVWLTGPVPRVHPERNWGIGPSVGRVRTPAGVVDDEVPEDASLVFDTRDGLVLLAGCGHAGVINTVVHARRMLRGAPVRAAVGGFHLFAATDSALAWTAARLREAGLRELLAGHCTGIEATYRLRTAVGLDRRSAVVSAVGSSYSLAGGIDALRVAR